MNLRRVFLAFTLISGFVMSQFAIADSTSNKWRIEFDGSADSDGAITLRLSPKGGIPFDVTTTITDGTSENKVAKTVVESLKSQLPKDGYSVERDDGEDVLIKRKSGVANFGLEVISNTVKNVDIDLDKE